MYTQYFAKSDILNEFIEQEDYRVFDVEKAEERTQVHTDFGLALVEKGNYIVATPDGKRFGIAREDLDLNYIKVSKLQAFLESLPKEAK